MRTSAPCIRLFVSALSVGALCLESHAQVVEFPVPTANSRPYTICAGSDGNLWFTESNGNKIGRITPDGTITEFPVPTAGSGPYGICTGRDGNIWFTERFADQIGRLVPSTGAITEFAIPTPFCQAWDITLAADGDLWFTEEDVAQIGRINTSGGITEYSSIGCCFPTGIAAGPGGNLWYALEIGDQIGRIFPNGTVTQYQIQTVQVLPWDIAPGPDGNMWFTELAGRALGRITPTGVITEFPVTGSFSGIAGVAAGPDGNLWFTENDTHQVRGMTPAGVELPIHPTSDRPLSICLGPDGNMWFTVADGNKIGRLSLAQANRAYVLSTDAGFVPTVRNAPLGTTVQWTITGPNDHSVRDATGLALFAPVTLPPVSYHTFQYPASGGFIVGDAPFPRGGINVAVSVPPTAPVGQPFNVIWSLSGVPAGLVEDVIVLTPGAPDYVPFITSSASSAQYTPSGPGFYLFRARLRNPSTGAASFYSRPVQVLAS